MISKREEEQDRLAQVPVTIPEKPRTRSKPLIVSILGGPGAGKSTTAAELFARFKRSGINSELVHEVAKDFTWEERWQSLKYQPYVIAKQLRNYDRLYGKVDVIVTDTSGLLAAIYLDPGSMSVRTSQMFLQYIENDWRDRDTLNVLLQRSDKIPYEVSGRSQSESEARMIDARIDELLRNGNFPYMTVPVDKNTTDEIEKEARLKLGMDHVISTINKDGGPLPPGHPDYAETPVDYTTMFTGGDRRAHY